MRVLRSAGGIAYLTAQELAEVDREATEKFGIAVLVLMEKAGLATATLAWQMIGQNPNASVVCLIGKGNNGGDGLVAARYLQRWGTKILAVLGAEKEEMRETPAGQLRRAEQEGVTFVGWESAIPRSHLIIDALLGYGSKGTPREPVAGLIRWANGSGLPVLAVDLPSGMDATTGGHSDPCIVAKATVTFGFPKTGFLEPGASPFLGELYLADISLPTEIYARYGMGKGPFRGEPLVRIGRA